MKKFLLTTSIAAAGLVKGFAQEADLQAFIYVDTGVAAFSAVLEDTADRTNDNTLLLAKRGQQFSPTFNFQRSNGDSTYMMWGVWQNGPDPIDQGSEVMYLNSFSRFLTAEECIEQNVTCSDTQRYFWVYRSIRPSIADANTYAVLNSYEATDSIGLLVDWNRWVDSGIMSLVGAPWDGTDPYELNKPYGIFQRVYGIGSTTSPTNIDNFPRNNVYVQKIMFNRNSSIKDMLAKRSVEALTVFPNPANNEINFTYNFKQNSVGDMFIKDLSGRIVKVQNFGRQAAGERTFKANISGLAAGNYIVEFQTGETIAVSKFTVAK